MAKQKKPATEEPEDQQLDFINQLRLSHIMSAGLFLDYCDTIGKLEGIDPDVVKQRVRSRVQHLMPPPVEKKNKK